MALGKLFEGVAKNLKTDFDERARLLGHPGETGTGRENVLKYILSKYLPKRYAVDSGFVIDALGNKSRQIDVVIYEADYTPIFEIVEGERFFPCEGVAAVGQVRTNIGSAGSMQECLENIKSVKKLDRSNRGTNELITGPGVSLKGLHFDPINKFRDQIFGFIFCSSSMGVEGIAEQFKVFNKQNERRFWLNLMLNFNEFLIEYEAVTDKDRYLTSDPMKATHLAITEKSETPNIFAWFVGILNDFLNKAHVARPDMFSYCHLDFITHYEIPL